ncbi:hypothetical protein [Pandoraea sputorum]|uniref:hypothetical protein n=1 Tax=Pandoraea sputorum TaxID=93222 RepID=UPI001242EC5F|nr:hypothetical protein [Pandoraea sputorum]VVE43744.1 hypothetical protein PSP20601_04283 [Pandoraea sputorum]
MNIEINETHNTIIATANGKTVVINVNPQTLSNAKAKSKGDLDFARAVLNEIARVLDKAQEGE